MSVLNWNCCRLGNPRIINTLKRAWKQEAPICVFLMETKLSTDQMNTKKQNWDYNQALMVSNEGRSGGLSDTKVHVKNFSRWFIDAHVFCEMTGICRRLTGFYGQPETSKCEETWTLLESLKQTITFPGFTLVILMRLQASPRKRVVAYGQRAKWIVFALPFTIVISLTLDTLALHSHGTVITLWKVVFISG